MTDDIDELRQDVEALRERVVELEDQLDSGGNETASATQYDRYDRHVLDRCDPTETQPRQVMKYYAEAGVHDKAKQKRRTKRLKRIEGGK